MKKNPENILVLNLGGLGDLLLCTPALRALRNHFPQSRIFLLAFSGSAGVVGFAGKKGEQLVHEIICADGIGGIRPVSGSSGGSCAGMLRLIRYLRSKKPDVLINMRSIGSWSGSWKMACLCFAIGAGCRAGRNTAGRGWFFNVKLPETHFGDMHEVDYNIELVKMLGVAKADRTVFLQVDEEDRKHAEEFLSENGISGKDDIIGINPGGPPAKRWSLENFRAVAAHLHMKRKSRFIVTGAREEAELGNAFCNSGFPVVNAAGRTDIGTLIALIERCRLYITNDTGSMHLAAALGIPLVALFGPGHINKFRPFCLETSCAVVYNKADCAPCERRICDMRKCMESITPDDVIGAAEKLLE